MKEIKEALEVLGNSRVAYAYPSREEAMKTALAALRTMEWLSKDNLLDCNKASVIEKFRYFKVVK